MTVEVMSPDDRMREVMAKLADYQAMGVPNIWFADPEVRRQYLFRDGSLNAVPVFSLPEFGLVLPPEDLFG